MLIPNLCAGHCKTINRLDACGLAHTVVETSLNRIANSKFWSGRAGIGEITPATAASPADLLELSENVRDDRRSAPQDLLHHLGAGCPRGTARKLLPAVPLRAENIRAVAARE